LFCKGSNPAAVTCMVRNCISNAAKDIIYFHCSLTRYTLWLNSIALIWILSSAYWFLLWSRRWFLLFYMYFVTMNIWSSRLDLCHPLLHIVWFIGV
jgi:hypothetical protein